MSTKIDIGVGKTIVLRIEEEAKIDHYEVRLIQSPERVDLITIVDIITGGPIKPRSSEWFRVHAVLARYKILEPAKLDSILSGLERSHLYDTPRI